MKEADYYEKLDEQKIRCNLCPHHCLIIPEHTGICKVRKNLKGSLYSLVYNHPISSSVDPIEKKPLFHFYPGSKAFSIATIGCNMHCKHCQNADISQAKSNRLPIGKNEPEDIVSQAKKSGSQSIAYTYTEPTIFYEYAYDIAKLAHTEGLKNVFVTNGFIEQEPLEHIAPFIDAANIDLKAFSEDFYHEICGARLQPILDAIKTYYDLGIWIEITTLIIPGLNDDEKSLTNIAEFIAELDNDIPWHVTGFYPTYKLTNKPATPLSSLQKAVDIGKKSGLHFIYQGNRGSGEDTFCPNCNKKIISRSNFFVSNNILKNDFCPFCKTQLAGVHLQSKYNF